MDAVTVHGVRVAYRRAGRGPAVLLLHGAMSDSREWRPAIAELSSGYDVIALDLLGSGGSSDPPKDLDLTGHADVLAAAVAALGLRSVHVVGLSMGSILALALYRDHPGIVSSMVLVGAYAGWAGSLPADEVEARTRMVLATLDQPVEEWGPPFLASVHGADAPLEVIEESMAMLRDVRPEASRRLVHAIAHADLRGVLPTIEVPVLLVYGDADQRAPRAVSVPLHVAIPGSELAFVPGAGHAVNVEAPGELNALVRQFLEDT